MLTALSTCFLTAHLPVDLWPPRYMLNIAGFFPTLYLRVASGRLLLFTDLALHRAPLVSQALLSATSPNLVSSQLPR